MMTGQSKPKRYRDWFVDSTRWDHYRPRAGDIVVATYPKCGTTWTQRIMSLLVFQSPEPVPVWQISPWVDCRFMMPVGEMAEFLEGQRHRRFLKSHLPFDGIPRYDQVRYVHVARDGRDACMSFYNHFSAMTPQALEKINSMAPEMGRPVPACPPDPREFWRQWLTMGVRDGERDGHPFRSFFDFEATYWGARHAENLLLVHFNDLKADLDGEMRRIAAFLGIEPRPESWPGLVEAATFRSMKSGGRDLLGSEADALFEGGVDRFLFKGTNGRWRDVMTADDLALYESAARRLTPGLARWLEGGRLQAGDPTSSTD